jgi:hypothetical protein
VIRDVYRLGDDLGVVADFIRKSSQHQPPAR